MRPKLEPLLQFAVQTAYEAGRLTLGYFRTALRPEFKADDSPVTLADREAEALIRRRIEKRYPEHGIVGEEQGDKEGREQAFRWIIDPIDGTKAFIRGVPLYAVLIGLEIEGRCEVGAVYFPALDEMLYAASGSGCFCNGRPVQVAATTSLARSYVSFTGAGSFEHHGRQAAFQRFLRQCYHSVGWSDAYGHALVATGQLELMLDPVLNPYDCAPFPPLLREAGGYFGDWSGNETIHGNEAISTTQGLLPEVLRLIRGD